MDYEEQDVEVVRLLSKLREAESSYPVDMMASRRQGYVKQIAALGIGTGAALALKGAANAAGGSSIPPIASTIVEAALIVAIVAEAGFVAFVHREKVLDVFRTISGEPTVVLVTESPDSSRPLLAPTEIVQTVFTVTAEATFVTGTPTPIQTPSPEMLVVTEPGSEDGLSASDPQINSTPNPGDNNGDNGNDNGNNGNHYGQTPRPERTKESGNNGGGPNESDDNKNNGNRRGN